jgi:hypothetical protein
VSAVANNVPKRCGTFQRTVVERATNPPNRCETFPATPIVAKNVAATERKTTMNITNLTLADLKSKMPNKTRIEYRPTPVVRLTDEQKLAQLEQLRGTIATKTPETTGQIEG